MATAVSRSPWPGLAAVLLVLGLGLHVAGVGFIDEHQIGKALQEALPFTSLLAAFFTIVAVIREQHLFSPIIHAVRQCRLGHSRACFSPPIAFFR